MTELSQFFIEKAKTELNEDDLNKQKSLEQFKSWVNSHRFIKVHDIDDVELLKYLRVRKYSLDAAYKSFENFIIFVKSHPEWFKFDEAEMETYLNYIKTNAMYSMNDRDDDGKRTFIGNFKIMDETSISVDELIKANNIHIMSLLVEEETQIAGVDVIYNYSGISLHLIKKYWSFRYSKIFKQIKTFPLRIKKVYLVGVPRFAIMLYNLIRKLLSEKIQNRIVIVENFDDLQKIKPSLKINENKAIIESNVLNNEKEILKTIQFYDKVEVDFKNM